MTVYEITAAGGIIIVLLTLIEITPIKINPWSALARAIGKAINSDVLKAQKETNTRLDDLQKEQKETREKLDRHIEDSAAANANECRQAILKFNNELLQGRGHTEEEFNNVLDVIDRYEDYCEKHPGYPNQRAVHAVKNIQRVYDVRLEKGDFLKPEE